MSIELDVPVGRERAVRLPGVRGGQRAFCLVQAALLLVAIALLYLAHIGGHPLQDPDEGRYAEIPREMIEAGDYVTPRWRCSRRASTSATTAPASTSRATASRLVASHAVRADRKSVV